LLKLLHFLLGSYSPTAVLDIGEALLFLVAPKFKSVASPSSNWYLRLSTDVCWNQEQTTGCSPKKQKRKPVYRPFYYIPKYLEIGIVTLNQNLYFDP
jgi:hypothetical protein